MSPDELQRRVSQYEWFHSIDLGHGIVTPGTKSPEVLSAEASAIFGPLDLRGRSLIDVGAWDGYFTIQAKRRGAANVLAADYPTWTHPQLRGKETFELATAALGVEADTRIIDVQQISVEKIGRWDVVLFLGVFYELTDPIAIVHRLAAITKEVLVVETLLDAQDIQRPAMMFHPGRELRDAPADCWAPNAACVEALLRAAGFREVRFARNPAAGLSETRGIFHAYK
jgi:tRNA (mo5U34)-methyltransferase